MSISTSIEALAYALAAHVRKAPLKDPVLVVYLAEISTMPLWVDLRDLSEWEDRVQRFRIDRETREQMEDRLFRLAENIFELGCYNLYGAIQADKTRAEFERIKGLLREVGVTELPRAEDFDFETW